ncbi:DEAD/DEAH box helicase [Crocinitomicaceae bacterium]|nr:DEAD/DEAH box helicase [Crocinitomicaceae bacterium]
MGNFADLGIRHGFEKSLSEMNITEPTDIQKRVIPLLLQEPKDIVAQAQTGTGKTAAYGLPLLEHMNPKNSKVQGLVLCPTRELGQQVAKQLFKFTKYSDKIFTEAVYGGEKIDRQIASLKRPTQIVVATPGRLIDLMERGAVDLSDVHTIILDEADEMLSMGFKSQLDQILLGLHEVQYKWLFSATLPVGVKDIVDAHMSTDAHRIEVSRDNIVNKKIRHEYLICDEGEKLWVLTQFLKSAQKNRGVIFCRTKSATQKLAKQLIAKNFTTEAIHGDLLQKEREKVMRAFKNKSLRVLVATDVAARGIDVEGLSFVVHYQLPESDEYYTHRSGRTARAGKDGVSLVIATTADVKTIRNYERTLGIKFVQLREKK